MNKSKRRTISQWCRAEGIKMLDPDGFDRKDKYLFQRYFTKAEFDKNTWACTITVKRHGKASKAIKKALERAG